MTIVRTEARMAESFLCDIQPKFELEIPVLAALYEVTNDRKPMMQKRANE